MLMTDLNLPIFKYDASGPYENGLKHGETFKEAIKELVKIRTSLLLKRSPHLKDKLDEFAQLQFEETMKFDAALAQELEGIAKGSDTTVRDIIILNNYTDFRDIQLDYDNQDEGCTSVSYIDETNSIAAQTWDMHQSAKNYLMLIDIVDEAKGTRQLIYTVCGCLGLMAVNNHGQFIGVNNINVVDGVNGIIWPALIRKAAQRDKLEEVGKLLMEAPITSGHNYLISDGKSAFNYEITPTQKEILNSDPKGLIFHTNHCLGKKIKTVEDPNNISKTTHARFDLVSKYKNEISDEASVMSLLMSHDGHPISICSHFAPEGAKDPSQTCGGALFNYQTQVFKAWRGCKKYDKNFEYVEIHLPLIL
ncbi:acyl-coenzyme A:6-aminopenicillanic acid acyl-transferase [Bacteriovorax sp. BAL6_X]|nr:acyl-coenzyme A:6-aminopenicillanic acid acyl-transferase [Bacteriovorax sp. BAL6_X]